MIPERWQEVERVCQAALDCRPDERAAVLDRECAGDSELRREVDSLLQQQADAEQVLGTSPWQAAAVEFADERDAQPSRFHGGSRLGPFEIEALIGVGGMGEVYRARDTRLGRTVALKVLPPEAAADPDRRARLEVEARAASALAHPHICALFDIRADEGVDYLVMEHLEGETLADRMARKAEADTAPSGLRVDEALEYAAQIAEALAAAHHHGIVHRDLKPDNVMLTRDGVKLLDFGLAKVKPPLAGVAALGGPRTAAGVLLGTVNYIAPEQLQGKEADPRSDLFAFGALLYEMLTGRRAFEGSTPASVLVAILERDPVVPAEWQPLAPALDRLVRGCLAKDPEQRWDSARLAAEELRRIAADVGQHDLRPLPPPRVGRPRRRPRTLALRATVSAAVVVVVAVVGGGLAWRAVHAPSSSLSRVQRLDLDLGMGFTVRPWLAPVVLSPDGSRVAFSGVRADGGTDLFIRRLDQGGVTPLGTGGGDAPFFSPDGQWLAYVRQGKLRKVSVAGGPEVELCDAQGGDLFRGGSWGDDGFIVGAFGLASGLSRLPAGGGEPVPLTTLDASRGEITHRWPQVLPGSQAVIFTAHTFVGHYDEATIEAVSLKTGQRKTLLRGGYYGRYLGSGHLVFVRQKALFAVPMNLARLALAGSPVPVLDSVVSDDDSGKLEFSSSSTGEALTLTGRWAAPPTVPTWRDQAGRSEPLPLPPDRYADPRVSPDGRRIVMTALLGRGVPQMVVYEQDRREPFRLVSSSMEISPIWAPDSEHLVFGAEGDHGIPNLYWRRADGAGGVHPLTSSPNVQIAGSFTPDGRRLAYVDIGPGAGAQTLLLPIDLRDPNQPVPGNPDRLMRTSASAPTPAFSPDGRWLAYASTEGTSPEVYVRAFEGGTAWRSRDDRWQISRSGGWNPVWSRDGTRIFFEAPGGYLMVAEVAAQGRALVAHAPRRWADWTLPPNEPRYTVRNFDLAPDGSRVLVLQPAAVAPGGEHQAAVTLLVNFFDELRRRAPARR